MTPAATCPRARWPAPRVLSPTLQSVSTTPNFSFITPNLCDDGHDYPCTNTTGAGVGGGSSVKDINQWLETWVPIILNSPAFQAERAARDHLRRGRATHVRRHGVLRRDGGAGRCQRGQRRISGPGGGKVGAVLISPFITPDSAPPTKTSYNHYSSLASIEDLFGLPHLGEAQTVTTTFDKHIYNNRQPPPGGLEPQATSWVARCTGAARFNMPVPRLSRSELPTAV